MGSTHVNGIDRSGLWTDTLPKSTIIAPLAPFHKNVLPVFLSKSEVMIRRFCARGRELSRGTKWV